jgi:hypothetical protein
MHQGTSRIGARQKAALMSNSSTQSYRRHRSLVTAIACFAGGGKYEPDDIRKLSIGSEEPFHVFNCSTRVRRIE